MTRTTFFQPINQIFIASKALFGSYIVETVSMVTLNVLCDDIHLHTLQNSCNLELGKCGFSPAYRGVGGNKQTITIIASWCNAIHYRVTNVFVIITIN